VPAQASAPCNLSGDFSRYVGLAEQARARGDYANAVRRFREILACDPNNAAAQQGLNRAIQGEEQNRNQ
jgi:Flp pilus assembly protein TadD